MSGIKDKLLKKFTTSEVESLQEQVQSLSEQNEVLAKKVAETEGKLADSRLENKKLHQKLDQTNQEADQKKSDWQISPNPTDTLRAASQGSPFHEEGIVLKDRIAALERELLRTRQDYDASQRQNDVLGHELEALRDVQSKLTAENRTLKQTVRSVSDTSYAELEHIRIDYAALQSDHARLQKTTAEEVSRMRDSLSSMQNENAELKEQIVRLEQNMNELRRNSATMSDKISSLKERNNHLNNENKLLHQSVREVGLQRETEMERMQAQLATLQVENSRMITTSADEKMKWQTIYNEIQGENKCMEVKLDKLGQELESSLRKKALLEEDLATMRNQNERMTNENRSLQQIVSREEDKRKSETDQLKNELSRVQFELATLQEKLVRTEQDLLSAQRECVGLNDDVNSLREKNGRLVVENKSLLESLRQ